MKMNIPNQLPFSDKTGELGCKVIKFKQKYNRLWWEAESSFPKFPKTYSRSDQAEIERELSLFVGKISDYMEQNLPTSKDREESLRAAISESKKYLKNLSDLSGISVDSLYSDGFKRSTKLFIEHVKQFDPSMKFENIYQALRNVWIMNALQLYLNRDIGYSNSIFAYSMLYPYTDNIMDDVSISVEEKLRLNRNLKNWLEGKSCPYSSPIENKIYHLIKLVEGDFPRDMFPGVFQSMLTIYNAQIRSLIQQRQDAPPYVIDILDISLEKGGTSVLADGYLVQGKLNENQEDFCFGFGAFLQFADDVQDVLTDRKNNHMTLFSQIAGNYKLDAVANKLFHFISMVVELHLSDPGFRKLREFIHKNSYLLVMEAIGTNSELYTSDYIEELETHFPLKFSALKKLRKKLKKSFSKQKRRAIHFDTVLMSSGSPKHV